MLCYHPLHSFVPALTHIPMRVAFAIFLFAAMVACGTKGNLELPPRTAPEQTNKAKPLQIAPNNLSTHQNTSR